MMRMEGVTVERGGWTFILPGYDARFTAEFRESLIDAALAAADGTLQKRARRSRFAETWIAHLGDPHGPVAFCKVLDAPRGLYAIKRWFRIARAHHVAAISAALRRDGLDVPEVLLFGAEDRGGREIIVTRRVAGALISFVLCQRPAELAAKRAMLRALGAEIARLHRVGYIHGDLTPYNVFVTSIVPPHFSFIDHERTRRTWLSRLERPRLRNLVQLGNFKLAGLSNTDRMRVWCGYSATPSIRPARRRAARRRVAAMLRARMARNEARTNAAATIVARSGQVGEV